MTISGTDLAGNSNEAATNQTFTIDNTLPTVALSYDPDRNVRDADTLTITATFSEAMNSAPTIAINTATGDDLAATAMTDSGDQITWTYSYDVPLGGDGTATVTISGTDLAGNSNDAATNQTFTIDNTAPTVALTYDPDRNVRDADTLTITATFNQAINGTPTIAINTTGTNLSATNMTDSGDQITWTYTYDVPSAGDGAATVTIAGATDDAGNANGAATNNSFTIDNTDPTVALTYNPDRDVRGADTLTITATFSEAINSAPTIAINTATGDDLAATAMTDSGDQITWTYSYDVPSASDGAATVAISGTDLAGNSNDAASNDSFTIDNTAPTVALTYNPDRNVRDDDTLTITATFNQAINGTPTIAINTTGTDLSATAMTDSGDQITWTYSYDVPSASNGAAAVTISDATDDAGNPNDAATNAFFTIDNTAPTVALTYNPDRDVREPDILTVTAVFSEAMEASPTIAINTTGTNLSATAMTDSGNQIAWTYSYDVPSGSDGAATVTISGTDPAGNPNDAATNETFTIDNTAPTVAITYIPDSNAKANEVLTIVATFDEAINGTPTIAIDTNGTDLVATDMTISGDAATWRYDYTVPTGSNGAATVTIAGATDDALNPNDEATNDQFNITGGGMAPVLQRAATLTMPWTVGRDIHPNATIPPDVPDTPQPTTPRNSNVMIDSRTPVWSLLRSANGRRRLRRRAGVKQHPLGKRQTAVGPR